MFTKRNLRRVVLSRLASTLAFVEHQANVVTPGSKSALTAAKQIGHPVTALVYGATAKEVAPQVAKFDGIEKVLVVNSSDSHYVSEPAAAFLAETVKSGGFTHLVACSSAVGKDIIPRASALLDVQPITDIIKVNGENEFVRPVYAGNALETVKTSQTLKIITARASAFVPIAESASEAPLEEVSEPSFSGAKAEFVSEELVKSERPELASASKIVSGGRGLKSKENFDKIILPFADKIGAAVGASRAAVDEGYCANTMQVGQTGKVVAPDYYIAVGISGAIQHLAGMKDAKVIAAIDKNEDAPIYQVADIGLVADLFKAVPEITENI